MSAVGFGAMHAFEPDHMAAVSTFVARRPTPREAVGFGVRWAIGHGLSLLLVGSALFALKMALDQPTLFASGVLDRFVGLVLVALGALMLWQMRAGAPTHGHHHAHDHAHHDHNHEGLGRGGGSIWMGVLHGAAGTGAFVSQAAVALATSSSGAGYAMVLAYTLAFSVGVLLAMGFYAGLLGRALSWSERRGAHAIRGARILTGLATCVVGVCLTLEVELPGFFDWVQH